MILSTFGTAKSVEGAPKTQTKCIVCGLTIENGLHAVQAPGRKAQLFPGATLHYVTAHDFWHPSLAAIFTEGFEIESPPVVISVPAALTDRTQSPEVEAEGDLFRGMEPAEVPSDDLFDEPISEPMGISTKSLRPAPSPSDPKRRPGPVRPGGPAAPLRSPVPGGARREPPRKTPPGRLPLERELPPLENPRGSPRRSATPSTARTLAHFGALDEEGVLQAKQICEAWSLEPEVGEKVVKVARRMGAHPFDLTNLIGFESGWNPRSHSKAGAVGLIQFVPRTLGSMGVSPERVLEMPAEDQLDLVARYLDNVRGPTRKLDGAQKLMMAVFYPAAIDWPPTKRFPEDIIRRNSWRKADGSIGSIQTPDDYLKMVEATARLRPSYIPEPSEVSEAGIFSQIGEWIQGFFGSSESSSVMSDRHARWGCPPGLEAVLWDSQGRRWNPGLVPPGQYRLEVKGVPPLEVILEPGGFYRASPLGRLFDVVDGE